MNREKAASFNRAQYLAEDCPMGLPATKRGALITKAEMKHVSQWLRDRLGEPVTIWRRNKTQL